MDGEGALSIIRVHLPWVLSLLIDLEFYQGLGPEGAKEEACRLVEAGEAP